MISGIGSIVVQVYIIKDENANNVTQGFFTLAQLFNVAVLSDFVYEYIRTRSEANAALEFELPT